MFSKGKSRDDHHHQQQPPPAAPPMATGGRRAVPPAPSHPQGPRGPRPSTAPNQNHPRQQQLHPQHAASSQQHQQQQQKVTFVPQVSKSQPGHGGGGPQLHHYPSQPSTLGGARPSSSPSTGRGPPSSGGSSVERRVYVPGAFSGRRAPLSSDHGTSSISTGGSLTLVPSSTHGGPGSSLSQRGMMMAMADHGMVPCAPGTASSGGNRSSYPDPFSITGVRGAEQEMLLPQAHQQRHVSSSVDSHGGAVAPSDVGSTASSWISSSTATGVTYAYPGGARSSHNPYKVNHVYDEYASVGPEDDDWLHDVKFKQMSKRAKRKPGAPRVATDVDRFRWRSCCCCSCRGIVNISVLLLLALILVSLFLGYPVLSYLFTEVIGHHGGFGLGGTNATGQIPDFGKYLRQGLIDRDTPKTAYSRMNLAGTKKFNLVFSDEFQTDGRSFYPGDDPFWEALDQWYWETGDYEWYDPSAITTHNGSLVITLSEKVNHNNYFRSGVMSSWNKMCFTGGLVETRVVMPGSPTVAGFWPAIWMMGNLGRAGYGATTHGMWPYTYGACDVGTLPNQTYPKSQGGGPEAALTSGSRGRSLSWLPGQRLSACTCPDEDHPGPKLKDGTWGARSAPELDIFEGDAAPGGGHMSLSLQSAPFSKGYNLDESKGIWFDPDRAKRNPYHGGHYQQSISGVCSTDSDNYERSANAYQTHAVEYRPGPKGSYVVWSVSGKRAWSIDLDEAMGPDPDTQISGRYIPAEPMYIIMNLAMSYSFSKPNWDELKFPAHFKIDYIRIYQPEGEENVGCDPKDHPTSEYIQRHWEAYTNPNLTTWTEPKGHRAGYGHPFPRNRLMHKC